MERLRALMRMTAVRLSAVYLAFFAVFSVVLVVYITETAANILNNQARAAIEEEIVELGRIYRVAGISGLVRSIDQRSRRPGALLYLVTDPTGRILAGNVQSLQPGVLDETGFVGEAFGYERFAEEFSERYHLAIAQVVALPNGMRVLVGRDQSEMERFRDVVRRALIFALGLMGIGALIAWFLVGRSALQRIDRLSASSARIMAGDLTERLPVTGAHDEFDRLSANMNTLLARIALLQEGLRQVSDNIAHDLKTPLARLRNRAETALAGSSEDDQKRAVLEGMIAEADHMIRTFDALLMISRVESGFHPAEKALVDLETIVADVVELYEPLAEEAGVRLAPGELMPVQAVVSRELIAQALSNLVDNALKYSVTGEREARVTINLRSDDGECRLSVADNGPGIPEDKRERVLERFFRLDESRSKSGSGLGLSLVQAIAKLHNGRIVFEHAHPGLRVILVLPKGERADAHDG